MNDATQVRVPKWAGLAIWASSALVGLLFVLAGWSKWTGPEKALALAHALGISSATSPYLVQSLAGVELAVGLCLLAGFRSQVLARLTVVMLLSFSIVVGVLSFLGTAPSCGCFGEWFSGTLLTDPRLGVYRNMALLALMVPLLLRCEGRIFTARVAEGR